MLDYNSSCEVILQVFLNVNDSVLALDIARELCNPHGRLLFE
jgi:hypothetical protein